MGLRGARDLLELQRVWDDMSLFSEYLRERTEIEMIENDYGFITFSIEGDNCYIRDLYIVPAERKNHWATDLANRVRDIALSRKCKYLTGSVCPQAKNATDSLKVLLAYGMRLDSAANNLIIFKKEII